LITVGLNCSHQVAALCFKFVKVVLEILKLLGLLVPSCFELFNANNAFLSGFSGSDLQKKSSRLGFFE
jgi:hypothetical protein